MKYLPFIFCFFLSLALSGQNNPPFYKDLAIIPFSLEENNGQFVPQWNRKQIQYSTAGFKPYQIDTIFFDGADLKVNLSPILLHQAQLGYRLGAAIVDERDEVTYSSEKALVLDGPFRLSWKGFLEQRLDLNDTYRLALKMDVYGESCDQVPTLELKNKLLYNIANYGSFALLGAGFIYREQAVNKYRRYQEDWRTKKDGDFASIRTDNNAAKVLALGGIITLVINQTSYFLGARKQFTLAKRRYELYCSDRASIAIDPFVNTDAEFGFKLKLNF